MTPTFAPDSAVTPPTTLPVSGCSAPWPLPPLDHAMAAKGHFDELRGLAASTPDHGPAPAWRTFFQSLPDASPETLDRHHARLQRLIRDNGTSYTAQGDAPAELRPWELNLFFPLLLSHAEWQGLATGIQQRNPSADGIQRKLSSHVPASQLWACQLHRSTRRDAMNCPIETINTANHIPKAMVCIHHTGRNTTTDDPAGGSSHVIRNIANTRNRSTNIITA